MEASPFWVLHSRQKRPLFKDDRLRRGDCAPRGLSGNRRDPRQAGTGPGDRRAVSGKDRRWKTLVLAVEVKAEHCRAKLLKPGTATIGGARGSARMGSSA